LAHGDAAITALDIGDRTWTGAVALYSYPEEVIGGLCAAGFEIRAQLEREPYSIAEFPSRRCCLLARRLSSKRSVK